MIGNIIAPFEGYEPPLDPDSVFDPTTHIATEENFMKLLNHDIYDSKYIGYKVQLSNTVKYNDGIWIIADVNHDSTNTGQRRCYDLISQDCINPDNITPVYAYRTSKIRTWLNDTFYLGFNTNLKSHILNPKYNYHGSWYNDDKIILPSFTEVNGSTGTSESQYADNEGISYPIFTNNNSRIKNNDGSLPYDNFWWTRSLFTYDPDYRNWAINNSNGGLNAPYYTTNKCYVSPILRVS